MFIFSLCFFWKRIFRMTTSKRLTDNYTNLNVFISFGQHLLIKFALSLSIVYCEMLRSLTLKFILLDTCNIYNTLHIVITMLYVYDSKTWFCSMNSTYIPANISFLYDIFQIIYFHISKSEWWMKLFRWDIYLSSNHAIPKFNFH